MCRSSACLAVGLLLFTAPSWGQPVQGFQKGDKLAPYVAPKIYRATAAEERGEVVVQFSSPALRALRVADRGKRTRGWAYVWKEWPPFTLGKEVEAFSQAGKPLSKEAVVKALAKPVSVACFVYDEDDLDLDLDPVYLEVFRDDAVILVLRL